LGRLAPPDGAGVGFETTWVRHVPGDLKSANPIFISSQTEFEYQTMTVQRRGVELRPRFEYFASKATIISWQTSKDQTIDKFVLRDDLTWSDGKPLTAHDFEFAFQVIMTDAVPVLALRQNMVQVRWVKAYDDHTLVVFHKEPFATNMENMANFPAFPSTCTKSRWLKNLTMVAWHHRI
jgi:peptide/nickel transport system substrate-binding protein